MAERCPQCDGSGWVETEDDRLVSCECRERDLREQRRRLTQRKLRDHVPERYRDLAFERHPITEIATLHPLAVRAVRRYCDDVRANLETGQGLWLAGNKGTGKTTLAYLVSSSALTAGASVARWNTIDLLNRLRASYREDASPTTMEIIEAASTVDLLQLEDLAVPRPTDWVLEQLYTIINHRYEDQRAILFTSDVVFGEPFDPDRLAEAVGERTYSRLLEMCGDPEPLLGQDMRRPARLPARPSEAA